MKSNFQKIKKITNFEYDLYWKDVFRTNLLQSWQYGCAKEFAEKWKAHLFLIYQQDNIPFALVQVLTKTVSFLGGIARINRGPLLIGRKEDREYIENMLKAIDAVIRLAKKKRWWIVQIAPELPDESYVKEMLYGLGFKPIPAIPWGSGIIDLAYDENSIMMKFDGKWRNCLRKGMRLGAHVIAREPVGEYLEWLISEYRSFQTSKGFTGLSEELIRSLSNRHGGFWNFNLFVAYENEERAEQPIGAVVTIHHGNTATYLVGITNDLGRKMQANYVLLLKAIMEAKDKGLRWFDIGGLSENTPAGVAEFKKGLRAEPYKLIGEWRWNFFNGILRL